MIHSQDDCFQPLYLEHQDDALCIFLVVPHGQDEQPPGQFPVELDIKMLSNYKSTSIHNIYIYIPHLPPQVEDPTVELSNPKAETSKREAKRTNLNIFRRQ